MTEPRTVMDLINLLWAIPGMTPVRFSLDDEVNPPESGIRYFSESTDDLQTCINRLPDGSPELTICLVGRRNPNEKTNND